MEQYCKLLSYKLLRTVQNRGHDHFCILPTHCADFYSPLYYMQKEIA